MMRQLSTDKEINQFAKNQCNLWTGQENTSTGYTVNRKIRTWQTALFAVFSASKGKSRGIVIYPASRWLPKGFMDKIEKVD